MKKFVVLLAMLSVLCFGAVAQAGMVGINIASNDAGSTVPSGLSDGPTAPLTMTGWLNWNVDTNAWVGTGPAGMTVSWGYGGGTWGGVDNDGSCIPNTPNNVNNILDHTGVGGQYNCWVRVSGIPAGWGTFTAYTLGDDYGGAAGNRWDGLTGQTATDTHYDEGHRLDYVFTYPGGDGRSGGFIKAVQFSGDNVGGTTVVPEPAGLGLIGLALLAVRKRRS